MLTKDAIDFYGSRKKLADALSLKRASVYQWGERVPPLRAAELQRLTGGHLKFDPASYKGYWGQGKSPEARP